MAHRAGVPCCSAGEEEDNDEDLGNNNIVRFCKSLMSFSDSYDGDKFFTVQVRPCWLAAVVC